MSRNTNSWQVPASVVAKRTSNPIRKIVDNMKVAPHPDKKMISLSIGDPTVFGNLKTPEAAVDAVAEAVKSYKFNGYPPSVGYEAARQAIADEFSSDAAPLSAKDIVITSSCSGALDLAIGVLANEGQNILLPKPGFSLYQTLADSKGIEVRYYNLVPEKDWEIDLDHVKSLVDDKTTAILVNNPSNPCGSVYSKKHLVEVLQVAEELKLPVIADEIYADMVFDGYEYHSMASLTTTVPIVSTGGLAKKYMVPGWRLGWILIHDRQGVFDVEVRDGLTRLSTLILGANSIAQASLESIFKKTPKSYYKDVITLLQDNANYTFKRISDIKGLRPVKPAGAMYIMVGLDLDYFKDISNDADFCEKLVAEESVFCLPGQCFQFPNYFRIVFTPPMDQLEIAYERLQNFCVAHAK
eukprot:NODE_591_length_1341_cov_89.591433_g552_i0.p1 GENE.NODE_591_length_1341_cov_89.591433_g552_i0~~NODE_591_length_1341_cov_89.591433_g552_i0.p1  ORF type:complete len:411 (-),score=82.04 NODE_591_length_1341_cov_89.591433_g552_i0:60-1292(-)